MADMRILFGMLLISLFITGCLWAPLSESNETKTIPKKNESITVAKPNATTNISEPSNETGNGKLETTNKTQDTKPNITATTQADCATLTPDCESCLAKQGCGWCKSSNSCFLGEESGPSVSSCSANDWATTVSECKIVTEEESCSKITNCADCLSGTGCKWCIQGSTCTSESSAADCFGGWMTKSYQCNYASR